RRSTGLGGPATVACRSTSRRSPPCSAPRSRCRGARSCNGGRGPRRRGAFPLQTPPLFTATCFPLLGGGFSPSNTAPPHPAGGSPRVGRGGLPAVPDGKEMSSATAAGLLLALASTAALNWGFFTQHGAAGAMPPLTVRRPLASLRLLTGSRAWLAGFLVGLAGWALYVAALKLAPLSLVQAVSAGGLGLLA